MIKSLLFNSSLNIFISFLYISLLDLYDKVYLFRSSSFLIRTSISLVILFKMIVFNLSSFGFSRILSLRNSDCSISLLLMLASFAFLVVYVGKLGVVSKESKMFSEVSRILLGGEFCMYRIISIIDISMVSPFKKNESLLRLILFISLLDCSG